MQLRWHPDNEAGQSMEREYSKTKARGHPQWDENQERYLRTKYSHRSTTTDTTPRRGSRNIEVSIAIPQIIMEPQLPTEILICRIGRYTFRCINEQKIIHTNI